MSLELPLVPGDHSLGHILSLGGLGLGGAGLQVNKLPEIQLVWSWDSWGLYSLYPAVCGAL